MSDIVDELRRCIGVPLALDAADRIAELEKVVEAAEAVRVRMQYPIKGERLGGVAIPVCDELEEFLGTLRALRELEADDE